MNFLVHLYLFLVALGLRCCMQAFSSCGEQGLLSRDALASHCSGFSCRPQALVVAACGHSSCDLLALEHAGFSSCGAQV